MASLKATVYHLPGCKSAQKIDEGNLIVFETKAEAEAKGYRACKTCKP